MSTIRVSIIVPTKNEEITVDQFIDWCFEGFLKAKINGEIIFVDNSTDSTPQLAKKRGVTVINVSAPGLGTAYHQAQHNFMGDYVIMGDADCTYDFRKIKIFIDELNKGFDLIVGNRFRGHIEPGSMPFHHQYFGSPVTSWLFKFLLGIPTGDIHCGMRALTKDLYNRLPFSEPGWEYASEMIVAARNLGATIGEIPISFYKEPAGRVSHHKRGSWLSPFKAGWGTLRVIATYMLDRLLIAPFKLFAFLGLVLHIVYIFFKDYFLQYLNLGITFQIVLTLALLTSILLTNIGSIWKKIIYNNNNKLTFSDLKKNKKIFSALGIATLIQATVGVSIFLQWLFEDLGIPKSQIFNSSIFSIWLLFLSINIFVGGKFFLNSLDRILISQKISR